MDNHKLRKLAGLPLEEAKAPGDLQSRLLNIAKSKLDISTFTPVGRDRFDFLEVPVKAVGSALEAAYQEGYKDGVNSASKITESARYEDSTAFESDVSEIEMHFKAITKILTSAEWAEWMKATKSNYGFDAVSQSSDILKAVTVAQGKFDGFYDEMSLS